MTQARRIARLEREFGGPTDDELFEQAYGKYSRNLERIFEGWRGPDQEPLSTAETRALRARGVDNLASWLWYGVDEAEAAAFDRSPGQESSG